MNSLKGWILGVALCGATFSMHAQQSEVFVPRTNVKLSALAAIGIVNPAVSLWRISGSCFYGLFL